MFAVRMDILGTRQIDFAIKGLLKTVSDWRPLWPKIQELFYATESRQFSSQGAAGARGAWPPLSPRYAARKAAEWGRRPILVRSGRLRGSLTSKTGFSIADASSPTKLRLGTNVAYAGYHQDPDFAPRPPTRRPIDLTARQNLAFAKEFHHFVNRDALKQFGIQASMPFGARES